MLMIIIVKIIEVTEEEAMPANMDMSKDVVMSIDGWKNNHQLDDHTGQRSIPNVYHYICSICSVQGYYEQHGHVAVCQFQD